MSPSLLTFTISVLVVCGIHGFQPNRIIGPATEVCPKQRLYQVSIWERIQVEKKMDFACSGVVLDDYHILIAAHCVNDTKTSVLRVRSGCNDLKAPILMFRKVLKVHVHPKYHTRLVGKNEVMVNDIAILTIYPPLSLNELVAAVKLPKTDVKAGKVGVLVGWGVKEPKHSQSPSDVLLETTMKILPTEFCSPLMPINNFCAIDPDQARTLGDGDRGSPFIINNTVFGIASTGHDSPTHPSYFTNVFSYLHFIEKTLAKDMFSDQLVCRAPLNIIGRQN